MIYKLFCGTLAAALFILAIYVLLGGPPDGEWGERLKASAGLAFWGLGFLWALLRELKQERDQSNNNAELKNK